MKNRSSIFFISFLIASFISGCKKEDTLKNESGQVVVQGNFTLKVHVLHHTYVVPGLPVYLKKNVTSWPGADSSKYEFNAITDNAGNCEFNHLFPGNYYLYAHGFDIIAAATVVGYGGLTLNTATAPDNALQKTLMVSE